MLIVSIKYLYFKWFKLFVMQKLFVFLISLLISCSISFTQNVSGTGYPAETIPDSLKENANAVIRDQITAYTYVSAQKNILKIKKVVTVLNKNGDSESAFLVTYDKFRKVKDFYGYFYDKSGKLIDKINESDLGDFSGSAGEALFDDIRYKQYKPVINEYPYTAVYEYIVEYACSFYFPVWTAFDGFNVAIEKSEFSVKVPTGYKLNYKQINFIDQPFIESDGKNDLYTWKTGSQLAREDEPFSEDVINCTKTVLTAPSEFIMGGYMGKMSTWNDFASWIQQLNIGREVLSEKSNSEIKALVMNLSDEHEKVKVLYKYLQKKTRYFNIALGIGGYQPIEAQKVDEVGFSDCKGLSNYMKAILKCAGIESNYALVRSGGNFPKIIPDFAFSQFDHVILFVPLKEDTIWLECTNQTIPFGFLGDFTSDRYALVIKENGGDLIKTPVYELNDNFQRTVANVTINSDGNATADIARSFGGLQYDNYLEEIYSTAEDQKEWLYDYIDLPDFKINTFSFKQKKPDEPESELNLNLNVSTYATSSDKRIFLPLNLVNRSDYIPKKILHRWGDIVKNYSWTDTDSITYIIPDESIVEFLPEPIELSSSFGKYKSYTRLYGKTIVYYRHVEMLKGVFPKNTYDDLIKFYHDIRVADKAQVVITRNNT
jgi:hypothetical protein